MVFEFGGAWRCAVGSGDNFRDDEIPQLGGEE